MKIDMLGISFTLQSDEDSNYLKKVTDYYQAKLEATKLSVSTGDPIKLAILTGLLVVDEFFKARESGIVVQDMEEVEKITLHLIDTITQTLENNAPPPPHIKND